MSVHESNQIQADFWNAAGTLWTAMRDRFDDQVSHHGLAAIDALAPVQGETIIDIGCGAGTATLQIAARVGESGTVSGLDISPTMIQGASEYAAEQGVTNATFSVGDAMVEPFQGNADGVYSRFGVMFFSNATTAFANIVTALRPGGRLGFVCWQSPMENPWASRPLQVAGRFVDIPFGSDPTAPGPFSLGDRQKLESVLSNAGFVDIELNARTSPARIGSDIDDAVDFLFQLIPPVKALQENDPAKAAELRTTLKEELREWEGPNGVEAPSAVWIVTARSAE